MKLDSEFRQLIPSLTNEEYRQLEQNIIDEGCRDALVTWNDILLDGHNRYEICAKNNIPFKTTSIELKDRDEAIEWIIRNQFGRRNLPNYERGKLALKLETIISMRAKENQGKRTDLNIPPKSAEGSSPIDTRDEIAKLAGVGHDTIEKIKVIEREATPEQKEELSKGTKKINTVYKEIRPVKSKEKVIEEVIQGGEEKTKICSICGIRRFASEFYNGKGECKACHNYLRSTNEPNMREKIRAMNGHIVDGVDTILEDMKGKKPSEEGENKFIYDESITQLESIVNNFNIDTNKFLYMRSILKGQTKAKELLQKTISNLEKIINLMEE